MFISLVLHIVILFLQTKELDQSLILQWSPLTSLSCPFSHFKLFTSVMTGSLEEQTKYTLPPLNCLFQTFCCIKKLVTKSIMLVHLTYRTRLKLIFQTWPSAFQIHPYFPLNQFIKPSHALLRFLDGLTHIVHVLQNCLLCFPQLTHLHNHVQ